MQRMSGLFCAVSIASLMARYMSWLMAFFFSGRRSLITRVAPSSVTIRCSVMKQSFKQAAKLPLARSPEHTLHHLHGAPNRPRLLFNGDVVTREDRPCS